MKTGIIVGVKKDKNRDGTNNRLLLSVEISAPDDVQIVELILPFGLDVHPPVGSKVFLDEAGEAFKLAVAIDAGIGPDSEEGESIIYSIADGAIVASAHYKNNGDIEHVSVDGGFVNIRNSGVVEINGSTDFMVRFSALETAFNELKAAHNNHKHGGVDTGSGTSSGPDVSSAADISLAKIDDVKTN